VSAGSCVGLNAAPTFSAANEFRIRAVARNDGGLPISVFTLAIELLQPEFIADKQAAVTLLFAVADSQSDLPKPSRNLSAELASIPWRN
jgi:hypothetical protein